MRLTFKSVDFESSRPSIMRVGLIQAVKELKRKNAQLRGVSYTAVGAII